MHNPKKTYKSKLVARWSSSHDCIGVQINDRTKCAIYRWSELLCRPIKSMQVRSVKLIASFDSNANNVGVQFMSKVNCNRN